MKTTFYKKQTGTSLLEIVITIVIISIGLLGLGALQLNAMKFQKTASQRSEAVQSAYDLSDRMRANGLGVAASNYVYNTAYATTIATLPAVPSCALAKCTAVEVANIDIAQWLRNLGMRLNGGAGYVVANAVGGYDVTIMWRERNDQTDAAYIDPACPTGAPPAPGAGVRCFVVRFTP